MNINALTTMAHLEEFLAGTQPVAFSVLSTKDECYQRGSIRNETKMDARLKMSGMTEFFRHHCMSVPGIHLFAVIPAG